MVIDAHRATRRTVGDVRQRPKWELTRRLCQRGRTKQDSLKLNRLIDWLLVLTEELTVEFRRESRQFVVEKIVPCIVKLSRETGRE